MWTANVSSYSNSQLHTPTTNSAPRRSLPSFIEPKCQNFSFVRHIHHHLHNNTIARETLIKRSQVSFFESFLTQGKNVEILKQELLKAISPFDRGVEATPEDQERIDQIASKIEALNKVKEPLKSDLLNGKWELLYTTSQSILQSQATANLVPQNEKRVAVKFDKFKIADTNKITRKWSWSIGNYVLG